MLARVPWTPTLKVNPKPKLKRLDKNRRRHLVESIAAIMRVSEPTKFAFEGTCRHALRSVFCLQGWPWQAADALAADIVSTALNHVGAVRPTWKEAQPEYTQEGVIVEHRATCLRCGGGPLPEGHWKFCSGLCAHAHKQAIRRVTHSEEIAAAQRAQREAQGHRRQPERPCETCSRPFAPVTKAARFCCTSCANKGRAVNHPWRTR